MNEHDDVVALGFPHSIDARLECFPVKLLPPDSHEVF
tara:strand:+ start:9198 stop:9308 length:111 start_codon:yes stop_codon:yes gene_type:complete